MLEPWFPRNYQLKGDCILQRILFAGENWQIYVLSDSSQALFASEELSNYWISCGLLEESVLSSFRFGMRTFFFLQSPPDLLLTPVSHNLDYVTYEDGKSFAMALAETRKILPDASFANGVFVERYTRLLPDIGDSVSDLSESDDRLLGRWLSRGIGVSAGSVQRMLQLLPTVTQKGLEDILHTAHVIPHEMEKETQSDFQQHPKLASTKAEKFLLPGREELETFFQDYIIDIVQHPDDYKKMGIDFPSAFILQGPPGCGKTFAVEKLVDYLGWPCFTLDSGNVGSPYIHETSKKISSLFDEAIEKAPSVLVIDEMESFLSNRSDSGIGNGHHVEEVAEFLRKIPEATKKHVLVVAMTNMISRIDPAIRRKGRFDHILEVGMPSSQEVKAVLENGLSKVPHDEGINLSEIADSLSGHPLSDVAFTLREAARITAKKHQNAITQETFMSVLTSMGKNKSHSPAPIGFDIGNGDKK